MSTYELLRNAAIQEVQGNRNPLIDWPDWAAESDFKRGSQRPYGLWRLNNMILSKIGILVARKTKKAK